MNHSICPSALFIKHPHENQINFESILIDLPKDALKNFVGHDPKSFLSASPSSNSATGIIPGTRASTLCKACRTIGSSSTITSSTPCPALTPSPPLDRQAGYTYIQQPRLLVRASTYSKLSTRTKNLATDRSEPIAITQLTSILSARVHLDPIGDHYLHACRSAFHKHSAWARISVLDNVVNSLV